VFVLGRAAYGGLALEGLGLGELTFLPVGILFLLLVGGMALGCLGGFIVARSVR
jgi:hypothetical protein